MEEPLKKVGGNVFKNIYNNSMDTILKGTTKKVAGKTVKRATDYAIKKVTQNVVGQTAMSATISGGMTLFSKRIKLMF